MKRLLGILLCLCLLAGFFAGCNTEPAPETEKATETTPASAETQPAPDEPSAQELFTVAAKALAAQTDIVAEIKIERSSDLGLRQFAETTTQTASYVGRGTDELLAKIETTLSAYDSDSSFELLFSDGTLYGSFEDNLYYSELSGDEFLAQQLPVLLLDASLYETVERKEAANGTELRFSSPTRAEDWALPEDAEMLSASGQAALDADGSLREQIYELSYLYGDATLSFRYELTTDGTKPEDIAALIPAKTKGYENIKSMDALVALLRVGSILENVDIFSMEYYKSTTVQAAALMSIDYGKQAVWDDGTDLMLREQYSIQDVDYSTQEVGSTKVDVRDINGEITLKINGEDVDPDSAEYDDDPRESLERMKALRTDFLPTVADLEDAEITDLGCFELIEFSGNKNYGSAVKDIVCNDLFGDSTFLDNYATKYATRSVSGFVGVEKYTWLPTALNLQFQGAHTIQGTPCALLLSLNLGFDLSPQDAYSEIRDEPYPDQTPEQLPTPLFYEVSNDAGKKLYLFGTIHVGDDRTAYLPKVVQDAFDASDALAVEFDVDSFQNSLEDDEELQEQIASMYYYIDGTTVGNHLSPDAYKEVLPYVKLSGNYTPLAESMQVSLWSSMLDEFYLSQLHDMNAKKGADERLLRMAREQEKEILNVESFVQQMEVLTSFSDELNEVNLQSSVRCSRREYLDELRSLYEKWCLGDEEELRKELSMSDAEQRDKLDSDELAMYDEYREKLLTNRNEQMVQAAKEYLDGDKTVFYAVGLAHLLGEGGLVQSLRDAGCTVTLIDTKQ